jgi:dual specificity MAP kinase phosphatase
MLTPQVACSLAGLRIDNWSLLFLLLPILHERCLSCRAPSCSVVLEHLSVSRQHAQLSVDLAGTVNVMDMGAAHGTKLNDAWIKPQQPRELPVGGVLKFGASTRVYKLLSVEKV